jgi:hypothetical protein
MYFRFVNFVFYSTKIHDKLKAIFTSNKPNSSVRGKSFDLLGVLTKIRVKKTFIEWHERVTLEFPLSPPKGHI